MTKKAKKDGEEDGSLQEQNSPGACKSGSRTLQKSSRINISLNSIMN